MELIREKACCFTGHRFLSEEEKAALRGRLSEEVYRLWEQGMTTFLAGGALGFDTLAAQAVLSLRAEGLPGLRLVLVLPCLGQESHWSRRDAQLYQSLIKRADEVIYTGDAYTEGCMFLRNRYLVDHSSQCLCYLTKSGRSGTSYTVRYAKKQGLKIVNLAEQASSQLSLL